MPWLSVMRLRGPTCTLLYNPSVPEALSSPPAWESIRPLLWRILSTRAHAHAEKEEWRSELLGHDLSNPTRHKTTFKCCSHCTLKSARPASLL